MHPGGSKYPPHKPSLRVVFHLRHYHLTLKPYDTGHLVINSGRINSGRYSLIITIVSILKSETLLSRSSIGY